MPTRPVLAALAAAILLSACGGDRPPDVVLLTLDTTRADRLGCYGYFRDTSPHLDELARRSILFENALAHMSTTLPSHVSLMTSAHTIRHGVRGNFSAVNPPYEADGGLPTLGRLLADAGYVTAGFVSAAPLKRESGIADGFEVWREPEGNECSGRETTDAVLEWLRDGLRRDDRPMFLWVHYFDPHDPYRPPPPHHVAFRTSDELVAHLRDHAYTEWNHPQIQKVSNLYDGEIRAMDEQIGRLLAALEEAGRLDGAAVVVVGDHGEGLGQHDFVGHGRLSGEELRVPLLLKLPGAGPESGARSNRLTAVVDVVPTLVEELDLPVPDTVQQEFEGLNALLDDGWDGVLSERTLGRPEKVGPGFRWALTGPEWKYVHGTEDPDELFDLRTDPLETVNRLEDEPDVARRMREEIRRRLDETETLVGSLRELSPGHVEQLRALGYTD